MKGDHSEKILRTVHNRRAKKINTILNAKDEELFKVTKGKIDLPKKAKIYPSIICALCGEKVMEPRARIKDGKIVCIPCFEGDGQ
jgi:formylmethanofuran dehydrogenase subunit E